MQPSLHCSLRGRPTNPWNLHIDRSSSQAFSQAALWKRWHCWATRCQLGPVKKVAKMVKDHLPGILSYYSHRLTNAFSARGYRNRENFKTAILFHCEGLRLDNLALESA